LNRVTLSCVDSGANPHDGRLRRSASSDINLHTRAGFPLVSWAEAREHADRWQAGHPAVSVPIAVVKKFVDDDAASLGVQVAYWGFFSVFSLLLAFVAILGFALQGDPSLQKQVLDSTLDRMPVIGPQISGHIGSLTGSGAALAVGLAGALWTGLGVTLAMGSALDQLWAVPCLHRSGFVKSRVRGLLVLASVGVINIAATAAVGFATAGAINGAIAEALSLAAAAAVDLVVFLASFRLLTSAPVTIRQVLPGAALATGCWLLLQAAGGVYVTNVLKGSSQTYGGFAAVVGLLAWLLIAAEITLIAAEVNVVLALRLWPRSLAGALLPADERTLRDSVEARQRDPRQQISVTFGPQRARQDHGCPSEPSAQETQDP
jgi:membrane protein